MKFSRKKWIIFGVCLILTGAGSMALLKLMSLSDQPVQKARSAPHPAPATENPDHELKALGVQLKKKPGHTPILLRMAEIEHQSGKIDDAIGHWREVIHNEPDNAEAHLELGRALYEKGDSNGAIAETEAVLKINPKQVDALYNLGAIYANLGNPQRARSYWSQAVSADPKAASSQKARDGLARIGGV